MEKLENITKHLKEEIERERSCMEYFAQHQNYSAAAKSQLKIEAYEKSIYIVNTLF